MKNKLNIARHILFWSWNIIFIVFVNLGLMPFVGSDIMYGLRMGTINKDFVAFFVVVLLVPLLSTLLGFIYLRKDSKKLLELMYCIELPLLALTLFRIFFLRDLTIGVGFFLALFTVASLYLSVRLFFNKQTTSVSDLIGATTYLWCGAWIFLMLAFLVPPMAYGVFEGSKAVLTGLSKLSLGEIFSTMFGFFFVFIGAIFFVYTSTLFILFPIVYIYSSIKNWKRAALPLFKQRRGVASTYMIGTAALITILFTLLTGQKHDVVLKDLQNFSGTNVEKAKIKNNASFYRMALKDIYLAPYRYMGDYSQANFIQEIYYKTYGADFQSTAWIQKLFNNIARPFVYVGSSNGMAHDQQLAEKFYSEFFDGSIQEEERDSIRYAVQSTYSREQIDAGLININKKKVYLEKQELTIREQGEWADAEIHEVYYNPSSRPEEIFLHLKLPQGAVINGVWLSDNETKKFAATVSPRGAAQKVYKEIVKRGADPALVEQVGPQLYRFRIFPIPPNDIRYREKQVMHMWLSLRLLKQSDSAWELPVLTEKRNLYWDDNTQYVQNRQPQEKGQTWLPKEVKSEGRTTPTKIESVVSGQLVAGEPRNDLKPKLDCSLAIIVDTSFSMDSRKADIIKTVRNIEKMCAGSEVEYYVWKNGLSKIEGDPEKQIENQIFWGVFDTGDLAKTFLPENSQKSSVIVLTDKTFFREKEPSEDYKSLNKSIWFLLLDQEFPRSINDILLKRLYEVGGDIEINLDNVVSGISRQQYKQSHTDVLDIDKRYVWKTSKRVNKKDQGTTEPLLAHKLILHAVESGFTKNVSELDRLQKIALQSHIVSPYSSMIVLVDNAQKEMLEKAEQENDRFDREVETGKEILTSPKAPFEATAVPEPEEWALIIAVFGILLLHIYRNRFKLSRNYGTMCH